MNTSTRFSAASAPRRRAPSTLRIHLDEARAEWRKTVRVPAFALPTLVFPAAFYLFFAIVIPGQWGAYSKADYLLATYGTFGVIGPALFGFGVGVASERDAGWLALKRVSPMPLGAYFSAKIAMSLMFALVVTLLLSALGWGFGNLAMSPARWLLLVAVLLLGTLPFCALGLFVGALARGPAAVAIVNLIYLPMALLSGLWLPLFLFPEFLQRLAFAWPAYHLAQLALASVGQIGAQNAWLHVAALAGFTALFLWLAARRLRRMEG